MKDIYEEALREAMEPPKAVTCKACNANNPATPCAYPTEVNRRLTARIAELEGELAAAKKRLEDYSWRENPGQGMY